MKSVEFIVCIPIILTELYSVQVNKITSVYREKSKLGVRQKDIN